MAKKVQATNANLLSAARSMLSTEIQNAIPDPTQNNLNDVYNAIMNYQSARNVIVPALIERIGMQTVDTLAWENPLARYKKNPMRYGSTDEETFINMCKAKAYDPREGYDAAFQVYESYIMSAFHKINVQVQFPVTITYQNMRNAFLTETGIRDLIAGKFQSAVTAANWNEYLAMRGLIDTGYSEKLLPAVNVPAVTDEESAKELLAQIKTAADEFTFPNPENNIAGATSASDKLNLVWITTPKVNARISVNALAYAFNMDEADVKVQTVIVDKFTNSAIQGVLADIRFFRVRDQFREISDQKLANILSWNYFYTMVEQVSPSPFYPIRVFTTETVPIESDTATITFNAGTYTPGTEQELTASVSVSDKNYVPDLIDFEITGGATSKDTLVIPGTNILKTGADETGTLAINAVYRLFDGKNKKSANYTKAAG